MTSTSASSANISVIIPALNEAEAIGLALGSIQNCMGVERIVADGGSVDKTVEVARSFGAKVVHSPRGRARQMNAGAKAAKGGLLVFLHADTRLPEGFDNHIRGIMNQSNAIAGAFELQIDAPSPGLRIIEKVANWRSRRLQLPYGDQAIFLRADLFREIGGFPDLPIMEDFEFVRRLRSQGRVVIAPAAALTSARRWQKLGTLQTTLTNQAVVLAFCLGVDPSRLARWYRRNGI
ncbi:TIGR04283 family arsenosugar biosynthesis glycosyltransferase [Acidobacteria bacterium AH-259-L09]|nr:TIGR04283 family arsenosugar biosynthesis glycosyltransferase [Acidobacteria bacterium AH-259-L09]